MCIQSALNNSKKRCMIHEKQTIEKTACERARVFSASRNRVGSSNNQMIIIIKLILLQFSTMKTVANLCTHKRISQCFWATFRVHCRLTVASNMHSLQLLIWNDLPKGAIEEKKSNVLLFSFNRNELNVCEIFTTSSICYTLLIHKYWCDSELFVTSFFSQFFNYIPTKNNQMIHLNHSSSFFVTHALCISELTECFKLNWLAIKKMSNFCVWSAWKWWFVIWKMFNNKTRRFFPVFFSMHDEKMK